MTYGHPLWDETIIFAENCSWKAGPYLAKRMRNNEFEETERVIVALENNKPVAYCTFSLRDELPEISEYTPFIGFLFVDEKSRGKRLSEKLIEVASEYAKSIGYETIYILSGETLLYEKYGFVKISDEETVYGTVDQLFQKRLV
jgi:predicted N-acetyltransferase YhbS